MCCFDLPHYSVNDMPVDSKIQLSRRFSVNEAPDRGDIFSHAKVFFLTHAGHIRAYLHEMQPGMSLGTTRNLKP